LRFLGQEEGADIKVAAQACARAFSWYGIDLESVDPQQARRYIRSRSIRRELVAALDFCVTVRSCQSSSQTSRKLLVIPTVADPDDGRNRVRQALARRDQAALVELAQPEQAARLPASTQHLLASTLWSLGARAQAANVLQMAQRLEPGDFWINADLAVCLLQSHPAEAVRFFTAALALRPRSAVAHYNLGVALHGRGQVDEAVAEFRHAIRLDRGCFEAHDNLGNALQRPCTGTATSTRSLASARSTTRPELVVGAVRGALVCAMSLPPDILSPAGSEKHAPMPKAAIASQ
jgi:serine/threonine-protein kinase